MHWNQEKMTRVSWYILGSWERSGKDQANGRQEGSTDCSHLERCSLILIDFFVDVWWKQTFPFLFNFLLCLAQHR